LSQEKDYPSKKNMEEKEYSKIQMSFVKRQQFDSVKLNAYNYILVCCIEFFQGHFLGFE